MLTTVQLPHGVEAERGSENIFADVGLPDADKLNLISGLVIKILEISRRQRMDLADLAKALEFGEAKTLALLTGDLSLVNERELIACVNRLGYDVELSVRPAIGQSGTMRIA